MNVHVFIFSDPRQFDCDCAVCGGKMRDSVHGPDDNTRELLAVAVLIRRVELANIINPQDLKD